MKIRINQVLINLLQFADDTIFFCKDEVKNILVIKSILRCFETVSSLRVNFHKSKVGGTSLDLNVLVNYVMILNCDYISFPFEYS